jgi:hypothetical protein
MNSPTFDCSRTSFAQTFSTFLFNSRVANIALELPLIAIFLV